MTTGNTQPGDNSIGSCQIPAVNASIKPDVQPSYCLLYASLCGGLS